MSLKTFHILFIVASVTTTAGFGLWAFEVEPAYRGWGIACMVAAVVLVVYGVAFLKKMKREHL
jgi:hypothetical protein